MAGFERLKELKQIDTASLPCSYAREVNDEICEIEVCLKARKFDVE